MSTQMKFDQRNEQFNERNIPNIQMYVSSLQEQLQSNRGELQNLQNIVLNLKREKDTLTLQNQKKDTSIKELSKLLEINKLKIDSLELRNKELQSQNNEMNYKLIDLTQRNKTLKESNDLSKTNPQHKDLILKISSLQNLLDEVEVTKSKLEFDKKNLTERIKDLQKQRENEDNLLSFYRNSEISNYQKQIANLQEKINEMSSYNSPSLSAYGQNREIDKENSNPSQYLLEQLMTFEDKIKQLEENNFNLRKQNQEQNSKLAEAQMKLEHKDTVIESLQKELKDSLGEFQTKYQDVHQKNEDSLAQAKEYENQIGQLILERDELLRQNDDYKSVFSQFKNDIEEANAIFTQKTDIYEKTMVDYKDRIKEYRGKIQKLKMKIDELHEENNRLRTENSVVNQAIDSLDRTFQSENRNYINTTSNIQFNQSTPMQRILPNINLNEITKAREINDPLQETQIKSLEYYKSTLNRIDSSLKQNAIKEGFDSL